MTDATPRDLTLKLDFLNQGDYTMELMRDGQNAERFAADYKREILDVNRNSSIPVHMVSGGGWAAVITEK
jgi:alpha-glucosidase